ncbi:MAG TPA: ABC transporter ATP-binding protein [Rubrobacteraceae bacterium]|nr:ABC transporter ATP-binding protein [Rubrobacteraceae bacterium]
MRSAISLKGIGKKYRIYSSQSLRLKEILSFGRKERRRDFWALSDVDLEVEPGATLGVLGRNGAGKSTLLSIISGVSQPSTGTVEVNGRLAAIFSTGAGFNPEFTGRENVMLNGLILGIEHDELVERFDEIAAFADIGEFMEQPIKTYSSGMRSRLGFAVAVNVEPDVLLIDEALSAGDAAFKKKALQRMYDLRDSGTTVLFVSHSLGMVQRFCTDAVLLHKGRMVSSGSPEEVVTEYRNLLESSQEQQKDGNAGRDRLLEEAIGHEDQEDMGEAPAEKGASRGRGVRSGAAGVRVLSVELLDEARRPVDTIVSGSRLTVRVHVEYPRPALDSALSITLRDVASGVEVFSTGTADERTSLGSREAGERVAVEFTFDVPLRPGEFEVDASASTNPEEEQDRVSGAATLRVGRPGDESPARGLVYVPTTVEVLDPHA